MAESRIATPTPHAPHPTPTPHTPHPDFDERWGLLVGAELLPLGASGAIAIGQWLEHCGLVDWAVIESCWPLSTGR